MCPAKAFSPSASRTRGSEYLLTTVRTNSAVSGCAPMPGPTASTVFPATSLSKCSASRARREMAPSSVSGSGLGHELHAQGCDDGQRALGGGHRHQSRTRPQCGSRGHGGGARLAHRTCQDQHMPEITLVRSRGPRLADPSHVLPASHNSGRGWGRSPGLRWESRSVHHPLTHALASGREHVGNLGGREGHAEIGAQVFADEVAGIRRNSRGQIHRQHARGGKSRIDVAHNFQQESFQRLREPCSQQSIDKQGCVG